MKIKSTLCLAGALLAVCAGLTGGSSSEAEAATYGCYRVTAASLNLRARPLSTSPVVGVARRGDILEQRKLFCTPRGFWCAVRKGSLEGYADKAYMRKVACP
ncbi:SH3 domain-containing protein [Hyphomicrobium sp. CS1GBMeth3]|uniref:SH3 domain-containing protein n=1 Tax=Hyphomicrobium sp. CS1GBMeth3 TaxID=1892845 RepID=UPI00092FE6F3|nr:SH3 domain-containing protein [Hyphomicrobium sp. CS1GBMeth3]